MEFFVSEATAANRRFPVYLVDATDGLTPETGESAGQPQISKNGAAFTNTSATLTAVGNGHYYVVLTAAELDTEGYISIRYKSASTAEFNMDAKVKAINIHDGVRAGLTALPNAAADGAGGLPISDAGGLDLDGMNTNVSSILTDTAEIGTAGAGLTDLGGMSTGMKAEIVTEVLNALYDGGLILHRATIATVTSQTQFVIPATDDAPDDDAYNGALAVVIDGSDENQRSVRVVNDYDSGTRTVTIDAAADFTVTTADTLVILPMSTVGHIMDRALSAHTTAGSLGKAIADIESDATLIVADTNELQTDWANGGRLDLLIDAIKAVTDNLPDSGALNDLAAILVDTAEIGAAGAGLTDLGGMSTAMKAEVNAEVADVMKTDTISEMSQGAPPTTPTFEEAIMYPYMALVHKIDIDSGFKEFYNNAGTVIWKKALSDDGSNYVEAESETGP